MIKRASTILLTLFFLLTSAQVWGAAVEMNPAGHTNFKVNGATSLTDVQILNPTAESTMTSCKYTISSAGLKITTEKGEGKFSYTFSGVAASAPNKKCEITLVLHSSTNAKYRIVPIKSDGNWDYSMNYSYHGSGTKSITTYAQGTTAKFRIDFDNNNEAFVIEEIKIKCYIDQQIISSNGKDICKGEETNSGNRNSI